MDFQDEIAKQLSPFITIDPNIIEVPPDPEMGDYAVPCFKFAKQMKKSPSQIAVDLAQNLQPNAFFSRIINTGPYLNFFINKVFLAQEILSEIFLKKSKYGASELGKGKTIVVDFSSPNIAKPFGIAHIRSTVIGNAICNLYSKLGYKLVRINHLGDWGTQFGKLIVAYQKWGDVSLLESEGINHLVQIYIRFSELEETDCNLAIEARAWFKKLEDNDVEAKALWQRFREISIDEFEKYYKELGIKFDFVQGEAFYNDQLDSTLAYVKKRIPVEISDGAVIINLKDSGISTPVMLRKSDGASTYDLRDIAAALYRVQTFKPEKLIYVVDERQSLHFKQLFAVLNMLGEPLHEFVHVSFGKMTYEGVAMSTRHGNFVPLREVMEKAVNMALKIIKEKNPELENKEEVAKMIGVGALIFEDLTNDRMRDIEFKWEKALNFDGDTGAYLQYTYARICSIERKAQTKIDKNVDFALIQQSIEVEVIKLLKNFPSRVIEAAEAYKPNIIANYLISVAQAFNKFYTQCPVIKVDPSLRNARLLIVECVRIVLESGLSLLGIKAPHRL